MDPQEADILRMQKIIHQFDINRCKEFASWLTLYIRHLEADEEQFRTSIHQLQLSNRTLHILLSNGITTIGLLISKSAHENNLRILKGVGDKVLQEIKEKLIQLEYGNFIS